MWLIGARDTLRMALVVLLERVASVLRQGGPPPPPALLPGDEEDTNGKHGTKRGRLKTFAICVLGTAWVVLGLVGAFSVVSIYRSTVTLLDRQRFSAAVEAHIDRLGVPSLATIVATERSKRLAQQPINRKLYSELDAGIFSLEPPPRGLACVVDADASDGWCRTYVALGFCDTHQRFAVSRGCSAACGFCDTSSPPLPVLAAGSEGGGGVGGGGGGKL